MDLGAAVSRVTTWPIKASEHVRAFGHWWLQEFLALFPQPVADWLIERRSRTLVIALEPDAVILQLVSDRRRLVASSRVSKEEYSPTSIDAFLKSHRLKRRDLPLGLSLPSGSVFSRSFALPLETRRSLDAIVAQDLVAKTPFQLDAIHHAHVARRVGDKLLVWQWVARRTHVEEAAQALDLDPGEVAFIESPGARHDDGPLPVIALRQGAAGRSRWVQRISLVLAVAALALTATAVGAKLDRQQQLLDGLDAQIAAARTKARAVLSAIEKLEAEQARLQRLRSGRGEPGLLDLWEEATRILPAHTWLSELRLNETPEGRQVVMTGFSAAAASLVSLIERSPLFGEASLAGPVSVDQAEGKERFVIQAKVAGAVKPTTASR